MNLQQIRFGCTSLLGTNKVGLLRPDADGYYTVIVGALNMYNSAGELYVYEGAKALFENSSQFMRRVKRGVLRGEYAHPVMMPGQSRDAFAHRVLTIDENQVSHHFADVWLTFDQVGPDGKPIVAIMAKVKPCGPKGPFLKESLDNPKENVCFSIRSFTKDENVRGVRHRTLKTIVTFDYVNEPGMANAEKYKNPALESFSETTFGRGELERALAPREGELALESVRLTADELFHSMGWSNRTASREKRPSYLDW